MSTIDALLDAAKAATGASNDSELAARLGVRPSSVSNYRKGVSLPNAVVCATLAGLTGEPLVKVIGIVGEARAISREEKAVWRKLAGMAMALCLAVGFALPHKAQAADASFDKPTVYTLCEIMDRPNPSLRLLRMAMAGPLARLLPATSDPGQG
ncbi:DUF3693 domain-containing protein [Stenotrophomonas sp. Sm2017]|uniref:DUF3693 domain-containing protein n=1 Tax=Stenotrophomonas sp. Sm2017 TaxID=3002747 RepID=UPI0027E401DF|nr:DUF3693 domain-containing protein [Stenotrophomonas sp. Sm2017]MDQ7298027.1 DUF3693 domain-containing protein [Stenotrophomonas sp. Sm2017]